MSKVATVGFLHTWQAPLLQHSDTAVIQLIDETAAIAIGRVALLGRPIDIQIGFPEQNVKPVRERLELAADECLDVVGRKITIPRQQLEDFDIALRDAGKKRCSAGESRIA